MNRRDLERAIEDEVAEWPGVSVEFIEGSKHPKAKLMFGELQLSRAFPSTPSDSRRGLHKCLSDMRKVMKQLGAERPKPEPSEEETEKRYIKPNEGAALREHPVKGEPAAPKPDVVEQLVAVGAATPEQAKEARKPRPAPVVVEEDDDAAQDAAEARALEIREQADAVVDGVYFRMPAEVYHKVRRLSTSALQKIDVSPADFWKDSWLDPNPTVLTEKQEKDQSMARVVGSAYHTARLEPHLFEALYVRQIDKRDYPRKGLVATDTAVKAALKAMSEQQSVTGETTLERAERLVDAGYEGVVFAIEEARWAETVAGRIVLPAIVYDEILIDQQRIRGTGSIGEKMEGGAAEVSIFWTDAHGLKMKARVDYLTAAHWVDFKTFANPRRKRLSEVLADAFRYDRYHMQAVIYRDAIEHIRVKGLQIIGEATDAERAIIAAIQIKPRDLNCFYIFQQKGGVPNVLSREVEFFEVPVNTRINHAGASEEAIAAVEEGARRRTQLHMRAINDVERAKEAFNLYSQVYEPGEPWRPIEAEGTFGDVDFNKYWLEGIQ